MSTGNFLISKYELNGGSTIVPCRLQPETVALTDGTTANDPPSGPVNLSVSAKASKGNREYGIGMRCITGSWQGSPPAGYSGDNVVIPVLTEAAFAAYQIGVTLTYLGASLTVVARKEEFLR